MSKYSCNLKMQQNQLRYCSIAKDFFIGNKSRKEISVTYSISYQRTCQIINKFGSILRHPSRANMSILQKIDDFATQTRSQILKLKRLENTELDNGFTSLTLSTDVIKAPIALINAVGFKPAIIAHFILDFNEVYDKPYHGYLSDLSLDVGFIVRKYHIDKLKNINLIFDTGIYEWVVTAKIYNAYTTQERAQ